MSGKLMGLIYGLELTPSKREILLAMAENTKDDGSECRPGVPYISWKVDLSERQVQRIQKTLIADRLLVIVATPPRAPVEYRIDISAGKTKPAFVPRNKRKGDNTPPISAVEGDILAKNEGDILSDEVVRVTSHGSDESIKGDITTGKTMSVHLKDEPLKDSKKGSALARVAPSTPVSPAIALAIDHAANQAYQPIDNHTSAMMQADVFIRVFEGACQARNAPQYVPRTRTNKRIAAQWYVDGYTDDEIRRAVDTAFDEGRQVSFAFLGEKLSLARAGGRPSSVKGAFAQARASPPPVSPKVPSTSVGAPTLVLSKGAKS